MDVRAPEQTPKDDGYDMVLRFRATGPEHQDLGRAVSEILTETALGPVLGSQAAIRLRVLQPVIGSEPSVWELRLTVPSLSHLGKVLDWASGPGPDGSILHQLTSIADFDVIDEGVPLFRARRIT